MKVAVQRRHVVVTPPSGMDQHWMVRQLEDPVVAEGLLLGQTGARELRLALSARTTIRAVIRRADTGHRVGFGMAVPPMPPRTALEGLYAIPRAEDRDAFTAMYALDAATCYVFEILKRPSLVYRIAQDNPAAHAIIRRIGYRLTETVEHDGRTVLLFEIDQAGWARRRQRLDAAEQRNPSGLGAAFLVIDRPPFRPIPVPGPAARGDRADPPAGDSGVTEG